MTLDINIDLIILKSLNYDTPNHQKRHSEEMAPKQQRINVEKAVSRRAAPAKGYVANVYSSLTSPENASVVKSVAIFGVRVNLFRVLRSCDCLPSVKDTGSK